MTAVSTEDQQAASTEIGNFFLTDVYEQTLRAMLTKHAAHWVYWAPKTMAYPDRPSYLWDLHHLALRGHRQSGKTEAIVRSVCQGDVVISYNTRTRDDFVRRLEERLGKDHGVYNHTAIGIKRLIAAENPLELYKPRHIWVDDALWVFDRKLDKRAFAKWIIDQYGHAVPTVISIG
jgi:hypothetical protein